MDVRLIDHGKNVAFLTYNAMKAAKKYTDEEINDMCLIALFHDIGAFKTDEITRLVSFDAENALDHSVYGYLFIKNFSPLSDLAPAVFFHHVSAKYMESVPEYYRDLAQILHIADRMEILSRFGGKEKNAFAECLACAEKGIFDPALVPLFSKRENRIGQDVFWHNLCRINRDDSEVNDYLKMLVLSIDFKSRHTVNHTVATAELSRLIAGLFGLSAREVKRVTIGALLHDVGKAGIPVDILENPGRLDDREMTVMKTHILLTREALRGNVSEKIERIAFRHHERLDGSGYPFGLKGAEIGFSERIVMVADILSALSGVRSYKVSFPKDRVLAILGEMVENGKIDPLIVQKIAENYDYLICKTGKRTKPITESYDKLSADYARLLECAEVMREARDFRFGVLFGGAA
jgi:HD-GYP domain-containing protein (c-di-GMP phosphodiesterase class II)